MNMFFHALILIALMAGAASAENGDSSLTDLLIGFIVVFAIGMAIRHYLAKKSQIQPAGSKSCPNCGSPAEPDAEFCANCGGKLK